MVANGERIVETICGETGKTDEDAQFAEIGYGISALEFWAKNAPEMLADEKVETASPFVAAAASSRSATRRSASSA